MTRLLWCVAVVAFFISCSNEGSNDPVLNEQPFAPLTDSINKAPRDPDLYYRRGIMLYRSEEEELAKADLERAWNLKPREEYALSISTIMKRKGLDSAAAFLENALDKLPTSVALQMDLAKIYRDKGDTLKAASIADAILQQNPRQLDAITLKAELLNIQDKKPESIAVLERAHRLVPSDPDLAYDLAFEYALAKNAKSVAIADSMIKRRNIPSLEKAYYIKGVYYSETGQTSEAIRNFDEAIRLNYNFLDAIRDKGELLYRQKQYPQAMETFQLGLKISPSTAEFYYWTGRIQEAQGKKEDAKFSYEKAFSLDKSMKEAKDAADKL